MNISLSHPFVKAPSILIIDKLSSFVALIQVSSNACGRNFAQPPKLNYDQKKNQFALIPKIMDSFEHGGGRSDEQSETPMNSSITSIPRSSIFSYIITLLFVPILSILAISLPLPNYRLTSLVHRGVNATKYATIYFYPTQFPSPPYTLFSTQVLLQGASNPTAAYISIGENGTIETISPALLFIPVAFRHCIIDVTPLVIMPGMIDPHVHINSPGRAHWEGFDTAMRAAAAGGTTTMLDMPINSEPATVDKDSLEMKLTSLKQSSAIINIGFIGGVTPHNAQNLTYLLNNNVIALKSFLIETQSPDFRMMTLDDLLRAVMFLHEWAKGHPRRQPIPYIIHAELDDGEVDTGARAVANVDFDHSSYTEYERTRPSTWETSAVRAVLDIINGSQVHIHIAHVSSSDVADLLRVAKANGLGSARITAETCAHYLTFAAEEIKSGETLYKCAPPIRSAANRARLITETFSRSSNDRYIDIVSSDHSPCASSLKDTNGNLTAAWGGIAGLQYRLAATWQAAKVANASIVEMSRVLSEIPARLFGLDRSKGTLTVGHDADIVIWDPQAKFIVSPANCKHRVKESAFDGRTLRGEVQLTIVRGHAVFAQSGQGNHHVVSGKGRYLTLGPNGNLEQHDIYAMNS